MGVDGSPSLQHAANPRPPAISTNGMRNDATRQFNRERPCPSPASTTTRRANGTGGSARLRVRAPSRSARGGRRGGRSPARTPRSPIGHTSSRPSWNMRNMCAVHSPMPRTSVSSRTTSSSGRRFMRSSWTSPSSTLTARSRIDAAFAPDRPAPRNDSSGTTSTAGDRRDSAVEQGGEAAVDRLRGTTGQLLEADRARELGEVCPARARVAQLGRSEVLVRALEDAVAPARALRHRR